MAVKRLVLGKIRWISLEISIAGGSICRNNMRGEKINNYCAKHFSSFCKSFY